ncbi:hypothetical protein GPALN_010777 [Globodera pallida]|nr:hypothetical protein GPALN_010777 [Globodera pallida]
MPRKRNRKQPRLDLTGLGKNCSTIPVALLDQCFPYEESKTFGIEFRLPRTGGSCDDGLIICYLGSLATRTVDNVHSMNGLSVNSELFNVDNAVNNSLAKYCAGKLNVSWHGIKVHTEKSNGKVIMKLSTSLLEEEEQSFEMPDAERQFIIHFGNENEFSAYVTVDGQRVDLDIEKAEQYKQLAPKGAHLKDFVGFWTLGLDMLPWMDHEVELYVNRTCSCTMEAWFIRPTDGEPKDPKEPSTGIGGPKAKCIANATMEMPLKNNLKANRLIRIQMLIDGNAVNDSISFEFLDLSKTALMTFIISSGQNATIEMNGLSKKEMVNVYLPKGNGTRHADFIIALTEYSYGFVMNKSLLGGQEYFPTNWWKGLPFKDMTSLRFYGFVFRQSLRGRVHSTYNAGTSGSSDGCSNITPAPATVQLGEILLLLPELEAQGSESNDHTYGQIVRQLQYAEGNVERAAHMLRQIAPQKDNEKNE